METNNTNKQVNDLIFNQQDELMNDVSIFNGQNDDQTNKKVKKRRGNRQLQRYRRKLRKQAIASDAIASSSSSTITNVSIDSESKNSMEIKNQNMETTTSCIISKALVHGSTTITKNKINQQQKKNVKMKLNLNEPISIKEVNTLVELLKSTSIVTDDSMNYTSVHDEIFYQMLSTSFGDTTKLDDYFLNEIEKIEFVRYYTVFMSRLSYAKLLQQQWDYYYHIDITQNIWTDRKNRSTASCTNLKTIIRDT
ncbi:unnamed protein product [Didymodactylos carnosus]|uniref:Uncharacterized protein n=1 Tax=Didymodactylos carnosus TaxID=1234261 RepID=A0A816AJ14_9BILA|nr:unnamed protein product [Didymodactylos carnosus]CAF1598770.1 unnamed protein product [Didymodactylos carnosus]CAF4124449.1 unnamed protein product [Didymodactylos carnosus]CAF4474922.1 unnamed protein product [Didymodactylos carnosus]